MRVDDADMPRVARTLSEIAHTLASSDGSRARILRALELLRQLTSYDRCVLLKALPTKAPGELFAIPELVGSERKAMASRLAIVLGMMTDDGEAADEPTTSFLADTESRMHLSLPVIGLNETIGVLLVERSAAAYDEQHVRLLSVVAAQLGAYLTTLRLRDEEVERARQLGIALQRLEETDRRKDEFLALLGHELRNPLGAINNALHILGHPQVLSTTRYHQVIDRQLRHLSRIVDDLLDASRVRLGKIVLERQAVDVRTVVERWLEAFGTTPAVKAHDLQVEICDSPLVVDGDPVRLEQVFSNVLTNALKYTPAGGQVRVILTADKAQAVIRVKDTGIGMTQELLATVFDLFTQADESLARSQGGLGLGLALARGLVEKHGGTIEIFSPGLGCGSEVVIRLPLAAAVPKPVERRADPVQSPARLRILLVEDNDDAREILLDMLKVWGHDAMGASNGIEGVAHAKEFKPDVALVDIGLPGLNGYEVARRVRQELVTTPYLIALTGYGQPEDRRRAAEAGFDEHMVKPLNHTELKRRFANIRPQGPSA